MASQTKNIETHYYTNKKNISTYKGKAYKITISYLTFAYNIPFTEPVTFSTLKARAEQIVAKKNNAILDINISREPANFLFFKDKYTITIHCYPITLSAKEELENMDIKSQHLPQEYMEEYQKIS